MEKELKTTKQELREWLPGWKAVSECCGTYKFCGQYRSAYIMGDAAVTYKPGQTTFFKIGFGPLVVYTDYTVAWERG